MKLVLLEDVRDHLPQGFLPYQIFSIIVQKQEVGRIVLREGTDQELYFSGHIGYHIEPEFRGHHYAYQACLLLKQYIQKDHVIITCDPDNIASQKTIEKLGASLIEIKPVPSHLKKIFRPDEKVKCIYYWTVKTERSSS